MGATFSMAQYLTELDYSQLPEEVVTKCKELILDSVACAVGGSQTPIGRVTAEFARGLRGEPQATVIGAGFKTAVSTAAYVNASSINAMDYDDTGMGGHPGSSIIPAALALAEKLNKDGRSIILACIAGYEIGTRVAMAIEPSWERYRQVHGIGTAQTFGSMAACAKLLNLELDQTLNAFGIAGASAPVAHAGKFGWNDKSVPFVKDNVALPAEAGLRAALLAQLGYEGSESILDGERGYWVMAGSDRCDFDLLTDFSSWEILGVSLKPYPCCRWVHTTLDTVDRLLKENQPNLMEIDRIQVYSIQPVAEFFGKTNPRTFVDVEFSIPCCVALKLYEVPHSKWFQQKFWQRPDILELATNISVHLDEEFQQLYLELNRNSAKIPTRVEMILKDGKKLIGYSDDARGSPSNPMSREERLAKVKDLMSEQLSTQSQGSVILRIEHLENENDIRSLLQSF